MFQYVLKLADVAGRVAFVPPTDPGARENIKRELGKCRDKNGRTFLLILMLVSIACACRKEEGNKLSYYVTPYPYEIVNGHIHPKGESDSSTDECALLIEAAHVLAADLGIILIEA